MVEKLRVLELFSGIGGMHHALNLLGDVEVDVVAAMDINTVSNEVYKHNHPSTNLLNKNIAGLTKKELVKLAPDVVVMSPPCQPHTRQGKKRDMEDPRSSPLSHLSDLLPSLPSLKFLLLENVAGFETSKARDQVKTSLEAAGFECREFLLCPRQIGIPNSRLRYYLLARRQKGWGMEGLQNTFELLHRDGGVDQEVDCLESYLDEGSLEDLVEDQVLLKRSMLLDIVTKESRQSCCFTAGYTRYSEGTGSVIQERGDRDEVYARAGRTPDERVQILSELGLRYFSTREVARLLGFPSSFSFPASVGRRARYKALGNSLNVTVVSLLLKHLLAPSY